MAKKRKRLTRWPSEVVFRDEVLARNQQVAELLHILRPINASFSLFARKYSRYLGKRPETPVMTMSSCSFHHGDSPAEFILSLDCKEAYRSDSTARS